MKLAFLGLGVMGFPMAGHLQKAGHNVTVYNRNAEKSAKWVATHGGASAATPREAAAGADIVLMCVGNDNDVRSVVYGDDGALAGMKAGAVLVDRIHGAWGGVYRRVGGGWDGAKDGGTTEQGTGSRSGGREQFGPGARPQMLRSATAPGRRAGFRRPGAGAGPRVAGRGKMGRPTCRRMWDATVNGTSTARSQSSSSRSGASCSALNVPFRL